VEKVSDTDSMLAALGLKFVNVVAGAVSSFVTLRFFDGLTTGAKWSTFLGGWAVAAWGAPPIRDYLDAPPKIEILFVLLLGFFGMSIIAEAIRWIREGHLIAFIDRVVGRKGGTP
jgi:hypothetical protein